VLQLPIALPLIPLILMWSLLRGAQLVVEIVLEKGDPRREHFPVRYFVHVLVILRYGLVFLFVGFALLWLDIPSARLEPMPSFVQGFVLLIAAALSWLLLRYWETSLKLVIQFRELTPYREVVRRLLLEVVRFAMVIVAVWALLVVGLSLPRSFMHVLGTIAFPTTCFLLVLTIYTLIGVLTAYAIGFVLFLCVRVLELADRRRFTPATELITKRLDKASVYEREDGGVNRYQNHLASLTYVKPGAVRAGLLRLTLFVIGLLSRFWFNQGDLGGIPTILAARWVLIDGGRQLLFLTNYGGGWESYLDEFIDMGAVSGVNAIWTNTFLKTANCKCRYAFPKTNFYFWKGAQVEEPFKAYVRHSQIETIVWYSAYPTLSVINLNRNTELRQALFKQLPPYDLDSVFFKAGL
jgi:hypothetical protein